MVETQWKSWLKIALVLLVMAAFLGWFSPDTVAVQKTEAQAEKLATASQASEVYVSPAGLRYGPDPSARFDTRLDHVMAHTMPDPSKKKHSVFVVTERDAVVALLDEAWKKRGPPVVQGKTYKRELYTVAMGKVVGTQGERSIRLIVEAGTADVVTAFPVHNGEKKDAR